MRSKSKFIVPGILILLAGLCVMGYTMETKSYSIRIARVIYNGGGDWYSSRTALKNLAKFCNSQLDMSIDMEESQVEVGSEAIFNYPYLFLTGHGNMTFNNQEAGNLRTYLSSGGFLHICDNYGLDKYVKTEMKKVFPELEFKELPFNHPIYHQAYHFNYGLPKVHEHDGKPPKGFGLMFEGRLVCFYDYECDLGNGWEDAEVYNDPAEVRTRALQMGANILQYTFNN